MLRSMTGFGASSLALPRSDGAPLLFSLEIKSLNGRFFEASCRLPNGFLALENEIILHLKKALLRGKVTLFIRPESESSAFEKMMPLISVAKSYVEAIGRIEQECNVSGTLALSDLISLPNIFAFSRESLTEEQTKALFRGLDEAIEKIKSTRIAEGKSMQSDLYKRFVLCSEKVKAIQEVAQDLLNKRKEAIAQLRLKVEEGDEHAAIQLEDHYRALDKMDIHEEIIRFRHHLKTVVGVLENDAQEKGRRIDFLLQELMREVNTMAAKASSSAISSLVVDIKVDLEKAREQIQNVV